MTAYTKQDSNSTTLSLAVESALGTPSGPWLQREPNSYKSLGGTFKLVARQPINASRQQNKGVITDLDAGGGWQEDLTYPNIQSLAAGFMFAAFRTKNELPLTGAVASSHEYEVASGGAALVAGALVFAKNMINAANNGLHKVGSSSSGTIVVTDTGVLVNETSAVGTISQVGFEGASGDLTFNVTGSVQSLLSTALDFTTLGLVPGEWVFVGDDATADQFATAGCNGYKRVLSIAAHALVFDKTVSLGAATDAGASKTIRLFYGRYIKNESDPSLIVRTTYNLERQLNKAATDSSNVQAEYINGNVIDTVVFTFNSADKITYDVTTLGTTYETRDSAVGVKTGARPALISGGAFNTSVDLVHTGISICGAGSPLYAYLQDAAITVKNNTKANKALSVLGSFDLSPGQFEVTATATAYFADVTAQQAIIDNDSVTMELIAARDNSGMVFDLPLVTLGNGILTIAQNTPISLPLDVDAARNNVLNAGSDYTFSMTFFDYLPTLGMGAG